MRRLGQALILVMLVSAAYPAAGRAVTFGADLSKPVTSSLRCADLQIFPPIRNCSVESTDLATGESFFPPGGEGIITAVRVKVGPQTGPMQIVVEEALRKDNPSDPGHPTYACCKAIAMSPVFTPAANAITTIPTSFRVKQSLSPEPSGFYVDDHLSLSVLDPFVPIPATAAPNAFVGLWVPAWEAVGQERVGPASGGQGGMILMNADWEPVTGAAPAGGGGGPVGAPAKPAIAFPARVANVRDGNALLPLLCTLTTACEGALRLQNVGPPGRVGGLLRARSKKTIVYGSVRFKIPAGKKKTLSVKLKRAGKRLLREKQPAKAWVVINVKSGPPPPPTRITLKNPPG